jgi:hypothetical protein
MYDPQLIAPFKSGLSQYYRPFLIERDAFPTMIDCYSQRGVVKKREGTDLVGRLPRWNTITNTMDLFPIVGPPQVTTTTNHGLLTGDMVWLENIVGAAAVLDNAVYLITVTGLNTFTLQNLNTGANIPASGAGTAGDIYLPVLGLRTYYPRGSIDQQLVAFHPKKAFLFNPGVGFIDISFNPAPTPISWTGTKDNFFYTSNYAGSMWITNNVDVIRFWNGNAQGICDFTPAFDGPGTLLNGALLIMPYKGRLVALSTLEGGTRFFQRARWSQNGTPYYVSDATHVLPTGFAADIDAWRSDIPGKGGFIDADTTEQIIGAEIVNDVMIVAFQYSSWRLRYTGNEVLPFIWERIDTTFGSESTFSTVLFDNDVLYLSRRGIVRANTNRVERIDLEIPDIIEDFQTDTIGQGLQRVFGIRDYEDRLIFWSYGDSAQQANTPNKLLVYNYQDNTWAIFDIALSCLGRYKVSTNNIWSTWTTPWAGDETSWEDSTEEQLNEFVTVGGRVDSVVVQLMSPDLGTDVALGSDSAIGTTNYNFSLITKFMNPYFDKAKRCRLQYLDIYIDATALTTATITAITQANPAEITTNFILGVRPGDSVFIQNITDMSVLNGQQFTVLANTGVNSFTLENVNTIGQPAYANPVGQISIGAEITMLHYIDDNDSTPVVQRRINIAKDGTNGKYVRVFLGVIARFHQLQLTLSNGTMPFLAYPPDSTIDDQLDDTISGKTQFILQGMVLHTRAEGRLKQ